MTRTRALLALLPAIAAACTRSATTGHGARGTAETASISIKGSDTMVVLGQRWAEDFMKENPAIVVQVSGGGSATGITALIHGSADVCESSRPLTDPERSAVRAARGVDVVETKVALDALAVYVNESNPIRELTVRNLARIYQGEVTRWTSLGGVDHAIALYGRENNSGTYGYFKEHVLANADFAAAMQTLGGTSAVSHAVKEDPFGIGFGGVAYGEGVHLVALRRTESSPPVAPSEATAQDGTYPLSRFLYFYTVGDANSSVQRFVLWVARPEAQRTVAEVGYYPLPKKS